jgi:predicted nucleic acid-binding protein
MTDFAAVLDACVLYNAVVRDALLVQAESPSLYLPRWSREIIEEMTRNLEKVRGLSGSQVRHLTDQLLAAFPEAWVTDYEPLISVMQNDPEDRHVLAAAVKCGAQAIITFNGRHFRDEHLEPWGVKALTPDEFLLHQFHLDPAITVRKLCIQGQRLKWELPVVLKKLSPHTPAFVQIVSEWLGNTPSNVT